jgi:CheY-like chemotaxis protein
LIALSGYGQIRDKDKAARSGFDAHLTKPVSPGELVRTIESVIANHGIRSIPG